LAPQAFIDTSSSPAIAPYRARATTSTARLRVSGPRPIGISAAGHAAPAILVTRVAPNRSAIRPLTGRVATAPAGTANSASPRRPSLRCSASLMAGSRALQVAVATPSTKKKPSTATRARRSAGEVTRSRAG